MNNIINMDNIIIFVKIEILDYLNRQHNAIKNLRYKISYEKQTMSIECIFRWGEFSIKYILSVKELRDEYLQYRVIERMMGEISILFVNMAIDKQNTESQFTENE